MKIIIAGAGELGTHLAKLLSFEFLDITLIDNNQDTLAYAKSHLDIRIIKGNATSIGVLKDADVQNTGLIIAVTASETANITICALAKQLGAERCIARIYNTEFIEEENKAGFKKLGIDDLISPETLASEEIGQLLKQTAIDDTFEFEDGILRMIGTYLPASSKLIGQKVKEVAEAYSGLNYVPVALKRAGSQRTFIPHGHSRFKIGDQVYLITVGKGLDKIIKLIGKKNKEVRNVIILGGSKIGVLTAQKLSANGVYVKLIEKNKDKAEKIADELSDVIVINADGRDMDVLEDEAIEDMDSFVSVTGKSETNIMACLAAKSKDVKKAIALVENIGYFQLSHSIGIDTIINKKTLAANKIFRFVRKGKVISVNNLRNMNAELLEFKATEKSKACNKEIRKLNFPKDAIIGGVIRDKKGMIALGDFKIKAGDRLVICCLPSAIKKVEKLFK